MAGNRTASGQYRGRTAERSRQWATTCATLDTLAEPAVKRCIELDIAPTRLRGFSFQHAWTVDIMVPGNGPRDALAHMHVGFLPERDWTLLGYHRGDYRLVVDKAGPLHPGLRQAFIYDRKRREADVILALPTEQAWQAISSQLQILSALDEQSLKPIRRAARYSQA